MPDIVTSLHPRIPNSTWSMPVIDARDKFVGKYITIIDRNNDLESMLRGEYYDPNHIIGIFAQYLEEYLGDTTLSVIPVLAQDTGKWIVRYSDPTGKLREFVETPVPWAAELMYKSGFELRINPQLGISFFVTHNFGDDPTGKSHFEWLLRKKSEIFMARYDQMRGTYIDEMTWLADKKVFTRLSEKTDYDMCFIDIAGFKLFNDTFWDDEWDHAIRYFWEVVSACTYARPDDHIIHKWWDEFVVLLKHSEGWWQKLEEFVSTIQQYLKDNPYVFEYQWGENKIHFEVHTATHIADGVTPLTTVIGKLSKSAKPASAEMASFLRLINGTKTYDEYIKYREVIEQKITNLPEWKKVLLEKVMTFLERKLVFIQSISDGVREEFWSTLWEDIITDFRYTDTRGDCINILKLDAVIDSRVDQLFIIWRLQYMIWTISYILKKLSEERWEK